MKTKCEMLGRNELGQFVITTGSTQYIKKMMNGKAIDEHRRVWILVNGGIPSGKVIHHINENKKDNRIENLEMMDYTKHNQIHAHAPWNKGKKCPNISESKMGHFVTREQILKTKQTWKNKYIDSMIKIYELVNKGYSHKEISKELNLTKDTIAKRLGKYRKDYLSGGLK